VVVRAAVAFLSLTPGGLLTMREKLFVAIAWLPKAGADTRPLLIST